MFDFRIISSLLIILFVILILYHENNKLKKKINKIPEENNKEGFTDTSTNINDIVIKFNELKQQIQHVIETNIQYIGKYATKSDIEQNDISSIA